MSKPDRREDYLSRMLATAIQVRSYVEGFHKDDFLIDQKTQDAVACSLNTVFLRIFNSLSRERFQKDKPFSRLGCLHRSCTIQQDGRWQHDQFGYLDSSRCENRIRKAIVEIEEANRFGLTHQGQAGHRA